MPDALATTRYLQIVKGVRRDVRVVDGARSGSIPAMGAGPVYYESAPASDVAASPEGPLLRRDAVAPKAWPLPVSLKDLRHRRERGIRLRIEPDGMVVEPETYERRWVALQVRMEGRLGQAWFKRDFNASHCSPPTATPEATNAIPGGKKLPTTQPNVVATSQKK